MALMLVHGSNGPPSTAAAADELGVREEDIDAQFGVLPIDPARSLYCVQVVADRLPEPTATDGGLYPGPYANPEIGPADVNSEDPRPAGE